MFLKLLGFIPYAVIGIVLGISGIMWSNWQFWVIMTMMIASDIISFIQGAKDE